MKIEKTKLLEDLLNSTMKNIQRVEFFKTLDISVLNYKNSKEEWSILECIEHLNLYGDFYLPVIAKNIEANSGNSGNAIFRSGIIGNYFANLMRADTGKMKKMKSPADKNPCGSELSETVLERFLQQQNLLKSLLNDARQVDLTRVKNPISISKLIKLRLGDTFRFLIYHNERHILQAENILKK